MTPAGATGSPSPSPARHRAKGTAMNNVLIVLFVSILPATIGYIIGEQVGRKQDGYGLSILDMIREYYGWKLP